MAEPTQIREQAQLYLQIQAWLDLENQLKDMTRQVEASTLAHAQAEIRAAASAQAAMEARIGLEAAQRRNAEYETVLASRTMDEQAVTQARSEAAGMRAALDAANTSLATFRAAPPAPPPAPLPPTVVRSNRPIKFDVVVAQRDELGVAQRFAIIEKE